jgi:hypothetical protein
VKLGVSKPRGCAGCRPRGKQCAFIKRDCEQLRREEISYCYECSAFPCERLSHLDARYRRNYSYSMIGTLRDIQSQGVEAVLKVQRERYRCSRYGGVVCVHNSRCYTCIQ